LIVHESINVREELKVRGLPPLDTEKRPYEAFDVNLLKKEMCEKKADLTNDGDSSEGSDSAPSEDNLSDDEMMKILPLSLRNR
jgi:hypothetical protein